MERQPHCQPQTIEGLILDILADEAQIVHCLKEFFCMMLREISEGHYPIDRKGYMAKELMSAAAEKETALAAVLEAIAMFIEEEPLAWIMLTPGAIYQVTSQSPAIRYITFRIKTGQGMTNGIISAWVDGDEYESISGINEIPVMHSMDLGSQFDPGIVTLRNTGAVTLYIGNIQAT